MSDNYLYLILIKWLELRLDFFDLTKFNFHSQEDIVNFFSKSINGCSFSSWVCANSKSNADKITLQKYQHLFKALLNSPYSHVHIPANVEFFAKLFKHISINTNVELKNQIGLWLSGSDSSTQENSPLIIFDRMNLLRGLLHSSFAEEDFSTEWVSYLLMNAEFRNYLAGESLTNQDGKYCISSLLHNGFVSHIIHSKKEHPIYTELLELLFSQKNFYNHAYLASHPLQIKNDCVGLNQQIYLDNWLEFVCNEENRKQPLLLRNYNESSVASTSTANIVKTLLGSNLSNVSLLEESSPSPLLLENDFEFGKNLNVSMEELFPVVGNHQLFPYIDDRHDLSESPTEDWKEYLNPRV